jgi:hypothetical protein
LNGPRFAGARVFFRARVFFGACDFLRPVSFLETRTRESLHSLRLNSDP